MNFRWNRIIALALAIAAVLFAVRHGASCRAALDSIGHMGDNNSTDDRFVGFIVLGLIGAFVVAIVRIVIGDRSDSRGGRRDDPPGP